MERSEDWYGQAEDELAAAGTLLAGGHWFWCCFTCQQAAEKALKSALERLREDRMGHSLPDLCLRLSHHAPVPAAILDASRRLSRHYIPTRYPDAHPSGKPSEQFGESDARQAMSDAEEVIRFVATLV
jgi:HEPN domain-containing protein